MIWPWVFVTGLAAFLVGIGLGRWLEAGDWRWRLKKRLIRRRTRKMITRFRTDGWTKKAIHAARFPPSHD
jgi:hypothetical protein